MLRLLLRSTVTLVLSALGGSLVIFLLLRALGGDIATSILGVSADPASVAALGAELGLDRPWAVQYLDWLAGFAQGDLGRSYGLRYDIAEVIGNRIGVTLSLAFFAMVIAAALALFFGSYSAINAHRRRGGLVSAATQLGLAVPTFWVGLMMISVFSIQLGWLPSGEYVPWTESLWGAVRSLLMPVLALSIPLTAIFTRYVRSAMLDVLEEDFMRTARAKGRTLHGAIGVHGIRNASISLVTVGVMQLGVLIAGTVVIERVFSLPGLGDLVVSAIGSREVLVVQSTVFVILLIILCLNFLMDISYGLLDPRIRDAEREASHV
ncbi:ABC transporter permease [Qaidamihabitans albus]|uniref:ABC transporter permease n=1 Tax=Qaidamihabitans albus TaxID=2795733 RepID=UPI0018F173BB|nr:ABC transporter permease [Qaidamihabitans albus]